MKGLLVSQSNQNTKSQTLPLSWEDKVQISSKKAYKRQRQNRRQRGGGKKKTERKEEQLESNRGL
jgi:hypothetical protein